MSDQHLPTDPPPLPHAQKFVYGLGAVANGVAGAALGASVLQLFFNQVAGIPAVLVGATIMVSLLADVVLDPLIGRWSDHFRSRWGRRHPFMYAAALPTAVGFYLLWRAPVGLEPAAALGSALLIMIGLRVAVASYEVTSTALAPELAPGYHDRTTLLAYRWFFAIMALAVTRMVLWSVYLAKGPANPLGALNPARYAQFGAMVAGVTFFCMLASTLATHNRIKQLHIPPPKRSTVREIFAEVWGAVSHPGLIVTMASGLLGGTGVGVTEALSSYFYLHLWRLPEQAIGWLAPGGILASMVGIVLAPMVSKRFGKKRSMLGLFTISVFTSMIPIGAWLLGLIPVSASAMVYALLFGDVFVAAALGLMGIVIMTSMVADVATDQSARSGARSEALMFAANNLVPKFTIGFGAFIAGALLSYVGFPTHAQPGTVDPAIVRQLAMLYLPCILIFNGGSVAVLVFYPLDSATHERSLQTLRESAAVAAEAEVGAATSPVPERAA
jgi:Na+/melibiose symporter-like transporter